VDEPSKGILDLYGLTFYTMAEVIQKKDAALAARAQEIAQKVFRNTRMTLQPLPERPVR